MKVQNLFINFLLLFEQVAARQQQQRLLAQQTNNQTSAEIKNSHQKHDATKGISRINGARQLFSENDTTSDSSVSSTTMNSLKGGRKEPPQPPPPPLAPLSRGKTIKMENEDSDSIGNNSLASSTGLGNVGLGGISSTEDGENSLTSFEGLLNGIPNVDNPLGLAEEDSNSKESVRNSISRNKPLMLADLLEKKVDKEVPMLNGAISKDVRLGKN